MRTFWLVSFAAVFAFGVRAQTEMSQKDEPATFKARVNLVMVPVVVRDNKNKAIGSLKKEDFQLFDKGKPQEITRFSIERPGDHQEIKSSDINANPESPAAAPIFPDRFVAYLFDDIHISFGDLVRSREAADRHMNSLRPTDRGAIFTTSGQNILEFTDDRDKFHETLMRIQPRPIARSSMQECPDVGYYMGEMISNKNDAIALQAAITETIVCANLDPRDPNTQRTAEMMSQAAARRAVTNGEQETRVALSVLREVIRRMNGAPGQRIIIMTSPGFIAPEQQSEKMDLIDRAIRAKVIISTLDARGLYVPGFDMSRRVVETNSERVKQQYVRDEEMAKSDIMAEMASGTGGTFYQNNNDLDEGYRRIAEVPEYVYLLGFSPQNLKLDGSFHALKVTLKAHAGVSAQARKGYYAPKRLETAEETAKEEIEEALFSREEITEIPVQLHTQFFKSSDAMAKLSVMIHMDVKRLKFRKVEDRNHDVLTVISAVFDRNGNYVTGVKKTIEFRLKEETMAKLAQGISLRNTLDVKPGTYLVRLVVRDSEGQMMAAANGAVEIP